MFGFGNNQSHFSYCSEISHHSSFHHKDWAYFQWFVSVQGAARSKLSTGCSAKIVVFYYKSSMLCGSGTYIWNFSGLKFNRFLHAIRSSPTSGLHIFIVRLHNRSSTFTFSVWPFFFCTWSIVGVERPLPRRFAWGAKCKVKCARRFSELWCANLWIY